MISSKDAFAPLAQPFTPDHMVYCGASPLYIEEASNDYDISQSNIVAIQNVGCFAMGKTEKAAAAARDLFIDAASVAVYAESFGGYRHMSGELAAFIGGWEVERFRKEKGK